MLLTEALYFCISSCIASSPEGTAVSGGDGGLWGDPFLAVLITRVGLAGVEGLEELGVANTVLSPMMLSVSETVEFLTSAR